MELENNNQQLDIDGASLKIAIVLPYFNEKLGLELLENAKEELKKHGVENIEIIRTAGALEIPFACQKIIEKQKPDAIIALGAIIKGETSHYDMVCDTTYSGINTVQLKHNTPIIYGVMTCDNLEQAKRRSNKDGLNKGKQSAQAALIQTQL
ncbi:MAG: 6,7-dimethyl-8-ribityllumazine synthase [Nitrospirae bacterium]|nr:6,7-dimethyl-8-ribityllumazine synthase [Nitrospirota bacterium]